MLSYRISGQGGFEEYFGMSEMRLKIQTAEAATGEEEAAEKEKKAGTVATLETIVADNALPTTPDQSRVVVTLRGGQIVGSYMGDSGQSNMGSRTFYSRLGN